MESNLVLDVGSGVNPVEGENVVHFDINRSEKHLELVGDAQNLPFREDTFNMVHASHVLEHVVDPFRALLEFRRVTKRLVVVKVPSGRYEECVQDLSSEHLFSWTAKTLEQLLRKVFSSVKVSSVLNPKRGSTGFRHKVETIKFYLASLVWKNNELVAVSLK